MKEYNHRTQRWQEVESQDVYRFRSPRSGAKAPLDSRGWVWVLVACIGLIMMLDCLLGCAVKKAPEVSVKPALVFSPTRIVKFARREEVDGKIRLGAWASFRAEVYGQVQWCPVQSGWFWEDGSHVEPASCGQTLWTETRFVGPGKHGVRFTLISDYGEKFLFQGEVDVRLEGQ